jgi:hypothetical protein
MISHYFLKSLFCQVPLKFYRKYKYPFSHHLYKKKKQAGKQIKPTSYNHRSQIILKLTNHRISKKITMKSTLTSTSITLLLISTTAISGILANSPIPPSVTCTTNQDCITASRGSLCASNGLGGNVCFAQENETCFLIPTVSCATGLVAKYGRNNADETTCVCAKSETTETTVTETTTETIATTVTAATTTTSKTAASTTTATGTAIPVSGSMKNNEATVGVAGLLGFVALLNFF